MYNLERNVRVHFAERICPRATPAGVRPQARDFQPTRTDFKRPVCVVKTRLVSLNLEARGRVQEPVPV